MSRLDTRDYSHHLLVQLTYVGGILLTKAALKAIFGFKQALTPKAGGSFTSHEKVSAVAWYMELFHLNGT